MPKIQARKWKNEKWAGKVKKFIRWSKNESKRAYLEWKSASIWIRQTQIKFVWFRNKNKLDRNWQKENRTG